MSTIKARILLKTGNTAQWKSNNTFVPLLGEACVYLDRIPIYKKDTDILDYYIPGIKIGNGKNTIEELPFIGDEIILQEQIESLLTVSIENGKLVKL